LLQKTNIDSWLLKINAAGIKDTRRNKRSGHAAMSPSFHVTEGIVVNAYTTEARMTKNKNGCRKNLCF
jgi:hypothetical protein